jgi:GR25 family glycosyltransferase involved in LPS biosynthesis
MSEVVSVSDDVVVTTTVVPEVVSDESVVGSSSHIVVTDSSSPRIKQAGDIKNVLFLNLFYRKSRKENAIHQLKNLLGTDVDVQRVPGFHSLYNEDEDFSDGEFGRSKGHVKCLDIAIAKKWSHVLISEDDIHVLNNEECLSRLNHVLKSGVLWDVIILSGINFVDPDDKELKLVKGCEKDCIHAKEVQQPACYLVHGNYIETLRNALHIGYKHLKGSRKVEADPENGVTGWRTPFDEDFNFKYFGCDKVMMKLMKDPDYLWILLTPIPVVQWKTVSDISHEVKKHGNDYRFLRHLDTRLPDNEYDHADPPTAEVNIFTFCNLSATLLTECQILLEF